MSQKRRGNGQFDRSVPKGKTPPPSTPYSLDMLDERAVQQGEVTPEILRALGYSEEYVDRMFPAEPVKGFGRVNRWLLGIRKPK